MDSKSSDCGGISDLISSQEGLSPHKNPKSTTMFMKSQASFSVNSHYSAYYLPEELCLNQLFPEFFVGGLIKYFEDS